MLHSPSHRLRVVAVGGDVGEARRASRRRLAHGAPQHRDHLGTVDGGVGVCAVGDALGFRPILCLFIPSITAAQIRVILPCQNRPKLGAGGGAVGRVGGLVHAVHEAAGADKADGVLRPMVLGVGKILRIINDFDRRAAVHGQLDAVLRGQGVLDDLLGAIGMDEHRHRAGICVGNGNLHLGFPCPLGQLDAHGGGGAAVAGGLDLDRSLDRLAVLLCVLDGLVAQLGRRLGFAVFVGLDRARGAVGGGALRDGAAVGLGSGFDLGAVGLGGRHGGAAGRAAGLRGRCAAGGTAARRAAVRGKAPRSAEHHGRAL